MFKISILCFLFKIMFNNVTIIKKILINIINLSSQL